MANLPPISEMIMTSIDMLNETSGSETSTIQNHIESNYNSLPVDFSDLVSTHLEDMKTDGQLVMVNGCYKKPDSDAPLPARRGRGRPPKVKPALPSGYVAAPPRPRGRPPKTVDPVAPPPPVKVVPADGSGKKRGRPKDDKLASDIAPMAVVGNGERRGRGRPSKVKAPINMEALFGHPKIMANVLPFPEMIMTAIEKLNEETGSDESTIQKLIEYNYCSLPFDFSDLLSTHLGEMEQAGELVMFNDSYMKRGPRGRGRPMKEKPTLPPGYVTPPPRPRGRPRKHIDPPPVVVPIDIEVLP